MTEADRVGAAVDANWEREIEFLRGLVTRRSTLGHEALVIDLRDLEFMDSSGLRMIIELRNRDGATPVSFVAPGERVGRVLDMTGVRSKLTWVEDPREALG